MNLQTLCHYHHSLLTAAFDSDRMRGACDINGDPLDPDHPWSTIVALPSRELVRPANARTRAVMARLKQDWVRRFAN